MKWTVEKWIDIITEAYKTGQIGDWDLHDSPGGYAGDLACAFMHGPVLVRTASSHWSGGEKRWVPDERPIILFPPDWESFDEEEWKQIREGIRETLELEEYDHDKYDQYEKERIKRKEHAWPDPYKSNSTRSDWYYKIGGVDAEFARSLRVEL